MSDLKDACNVVESRTTQRHNYYMFADAAFTENVKRFVSSQQAKVERKYNDKWVDYLSKWCRWFDSYLEENKTDNLPPSWSSSEPLPMATVVTEGDAGTGKTFSINTLMRTMPDGTVSSFARKGTDAYLDYALPDTIPDGMNHVIENNTICKMFNVKFSQPKIRARLEDIRNDKELEESYERVLRDEQGFVNEKHAESITRNHFQLAARKLWPLVTECYNEMLNDFYHKGSSVFRRDVMDKEHPMYTGEKLVPRLLLRHVNSLVETLTSGTKENQQRCAMVKEQVRSSESTLDQDTYRLNVIMGTSSSNIRSPPAPVLFPVLLFEEDGMAPSCYGDIRKILTFISLMIYLPPYIMTTVPVIVSSGSTTQSAAIGSAASALEMCSTPSHLADKENVLLYKSEFFRRDKNDFQAKDTLACRATCMTLERCLPVSPYTYTSMYIHEEHPGLVEDPGYIAEGTRLYRRHADVCQYTQKMASFGKADLPVTDVVFIADNVVPIIVPAGVHDATDKGLSSLTENEARSNRIRMWRDKEKIYAGYKTEAENCGDLDIDDLYSDDSGCNLAHEQRIARLHHEAVRRQVAESSRKDKRRRVDEEVFLQSCDTGVVLAADESFNESALDDILYDRVVNDRKCRRMIKKIRTGDGKTTTEIPVDNDDDEPADNLSFIVGRAVNMLSKKEHLAKRQHAEAIAKKLGNGTALAQHYLNGSKVVDQVGKMTYDPLSDMVVEFARPNYNSSDFAKSLRTTTNARILYMTFKRVRYMVRNAPVTNEKTTTSVVFRGTNCTLSELLENTVFAQYAPHAYKCMVYGGVIVKFQEWCVSELDPSIPMDGIMLKDAYKKLRAKIPTAAREIFDEYDRLINGVLTSEGNNADKRTMVVELQLTAKLERMVLAICSRVGKQFAKEVQLNVYTDRSPLYPLLKYEDKPVPLSSLRLNSIGDIKLFDTGRSECNAVWRQEKERQRADNVACGAKYPPSLLRREENMSNGRYPMKPVTALWMGVEAFNYELYVDSICTLLLLDSLLVTTNPHCSAEVNWSTIFTEPKQKCPADKMKRDTLGLMLRRGMADMSASPKLTVNTMFRMKGGELMNLPRPLRPQTCGVFSDVILKTRNLVINSAKQQQQLSVDDDEELKIKRFEMAVMFGLMNPVYGTPASTVAYSQGSTHRGHVLLNFKKIGKSDQLVGLTRTTDTSKLKVASVMNAADEERGNANLTERRRKRIRCMSQYYYFRQ